jgi:peptidoglycan-associated lipoprotein
MKRLQIASAGLVLLLMFGGCASRDAGMKAPSSVAYENLASSEQDAALVDGRTAVADHAANAERAAGLAGETPGEMNANGRPSDPAERVVQAERETPAAPIVPAFPARMQQKTLRELQTVFFAFDSVALSEEVKRVLDRNIAWLKQHGKIAIRLVGHADERGTSEYNLGLGMRRASQVRAYLIERGVSPEALVTVSYGEEMPLRRAHAEEAWSMNRRVEFSRAEATALLRK